jgi:hypothetical protein
MHAQGQVTASVLAVRLCARTGTSDCISACSASVHGQGQVTESVLAVRLYARTGTIIHGCSNFTEL